MGRKKRKKPVRIMTLDTETRGLEGAIFRSGLYDGKHYWAFDDICDILQVLKNLSQDYRCHVYIHNMDFDLSKFVQHVINDADFSKSIFINNVAVVFPLLSYDITFHCSYRLLPSSLEKLSKDFGLEDEGKMDLDDYIKEQGYNDKEDFFKRVPSDDPVLNEYMKKDCTALYKILMKVIDISGLYPEDFVKCPTVASLAMKVFKEGYPDDYELITSTTYHGELGEQAERMARQAYYGGRTEVFKPFMDEGFHYDVNSLYPYVMKVNTFPVGWYELYTGGEAKNVFHAWNAGFFEGGGIVHCLIEVPENMHIPPLPYRPKKGRLAGKLIFPVGRLEGTWVYEEVQMALKHGCKLIEVYSCLHFRKREAVFEGYISEMEYIKTTSKGAKKQFAKLMQNSLYGKFGMQRKRLSFANKDDLEEILEKGQSYAVVENTTFQTELIRTVTESKAEYIQPHIAAYVTAYARILLYESIMKVLENNSDIAYCDTDSMVIDAELPPELVDDNEYGKWKLEYSFTDGIFYQPKFYYERATKDGKTFDVMKAKGIPKARVKELMSYDKYKDIVEKTMAGHDRYVLYDETLPNPIVQKPKLGTSLVHDIDPNVLRIMRKSINLRAEQKRIVDYKNNMTYPHIENDDIKEVDDFAKWMSEQEQLLEIEETLDQMIREYGKMQIPNKNSAYRHDYEQLSTQSKRKYFSKTGQFIDVWLQEVNEAFGSEYTEDDIFEMIRKVERENDVK